MKSIKITLIILFALFLKIHGQTNSVNLKDASNTIISQHSSITDAYNAIPATLTQAYYIEPTVTYDAAAETFPINFIAKAGASNANTITLRPDAAVSSLTISVNLAGNAIIILDDADYVIIDGRPGGVGTTGVLTLQHLSTSSNSNNILLRNGACFNQVLYCRLENATTSSTGRGVSLSTSVSNVTGNSDNIFKYCVFPGGRYQFNSSGTAANPNSRNTVFGCRFENIVFVGIWCQAGTGSITVDSCEFSRNTPSSESLAFGFLFDSQKDTTLIRNSRFNTFLNNSGTMRSIHIRSVLSSGTNSAHIYNNFIALAPTTNIPNLGGIEISSGASLFNFRVDNNSVRIGGSLASGGTAGNIGSSCLLLSSTNASSLGNVFNNLFFNERTGGTAGLQHVAMAITSTLDNYDLDHNTYNSSTTELVRLGTTVYTDIPTYQANSFPGNEANSNDVLINFVSATDLHLADTNTFLHGIPVAGITADIDGQTRSLVNPYRGADEYYEIVCMGTPDAGNTLADLDSICSGDSVSLSLSVATDSLLNYQWQSSTDGITFINIPSATGSTYTTTPLATTYYRCIVSCSASVSSDTSVVKLIFVGTIPSGGSIGESHTGLDYNYNFTVSGYSSEVTYDWDFGDGNNSQLQNPLHTYAANGSYTVQLIATNACGTDTLSMIVNITLGLEDNNAALFSIYPNPVSEGFWISSADITTLEYIRITDALGKTVYANNHVFSVPAYISISENQLRPGMYFLTIGSKGEQTTQRIIIK